MIAAKAWRDIRLIVLLYVLLLQSLLVIAILHWPALRDTRESLAPLKSMMPAAFLRRIMDDLMDPADVFAFRVYMAVQMFFKGANIIGVSCACLLGTAMIARERENGTLEFLLARPVSRARILATKYAVAAAALTVPLVVTSWTAVPLSAWIGEELPFGAVTTAALYASLYSVLFLTLAAILSVRLRTQMHVAFVVGSVIVFQVCLYFIPEIRRFSLWRLSDYDVYGPILAENVGPWALLRNEALWLLLATAAGYTIAHRLFRRAEL